ncbi:MAG TPA: hypothetical protein VM432_05995 [Bdellovibrionales bacterium]|nr:hypothetical protein [Bdellovibrionales bacterium]
MREPQGHITVNEHVPTQRFHRFVDEKVKDWLRDHGFEDQPSEYEVAFFDEDVLGEVSCLVVVQSGEQMWRSWETADNPRAALSRSLEHLAIEDDQPVNPGTPH